MIGENINMDVTFLSHRTIGTAECDESYCIEGAGIFFYHDSYCDVVMTIYGFQIFCDVGSGLGLWLVKTSIWMSPFWVIVRSGRRNVMNHIASRVRGFFLPWVILRRRHDHIWISIFLWRQFRGMGLCPYVGNGCVYGLIWERLSALGF